MIVADLSALSAEICFTLYDSFPAVSTVTSLNNPSASSAASVNVVFPLSAGRFPAISIVSALSLEPSA